jgi:tRNA/tmRNA/rRNA uracil-C5-methylase (TrmA/RlmC/RlmD family)
LAGCENVLDGFCGAGGDSIKLALNCNRVVSNDIDPRKVKLLENNAAVYGVDNIETTVSDFFEL